MGRQINRTSGAAALLGAASALALASAPPAAAQSTVAAQAAPRQVDVPAGPLQDALVDLADLYGVGIFATDDVVAGRSAAAISGAFTVDEALERALEGSGLIAFPSRTGGYVIVERSAAATDAPARTEPPAPAETIIVTGT
ncbi:MAG: STN domain-containing protein, partial [Pseudomonadota bacterium]